MSGVHNGHRKRLKEKYLRDGIDGFETHEILELMLYYAYPQIDTNPIAHKLLENFGSVSAIFDAPASLLLKSGLSENSSTFLKLIPDLTRVYYDDKYRNKSKRVDITKLCEYFKYKFLGRTTEVLYLLLLDGKRRELFCGVISKGTFSSTDLPVRKVLELAILYNASFAVLAHNHVSGMALPSRTDLTATQNIAKALKLINVQLTDHIIVSDNDSFDLAESIYSKYLYVPDDYSSEY